jgi:hypothetical protein
VYRQTSSLLQHIYAKTSKGHDEIVRPKFGLNPRQRRILMFVDGEHTLVTLHGHFPLQEMEEIVATLAGHHFIFMTGRQAQETASPCRRGKPRAAYTWRTGSELNSARHHDDVYPILTEDPEKILKAKELMLEIAATHLGILGRAIVQKIEAATCAASLSSLAGRWTMALCASKTASRYAALYLERLKCILYEEAADATPMPILALSSPRHTP